MQNIIRPIGTVTKHIYANQDALKKGLEKLQKAFPNLFFEQYAGYLNGYFILVRKTQTERFTDEEYNKFLISESSLES